MADSGKPLPKPSRVDALGALRTLGQLELAGALQVPQADQEELARAGIKRPAPIMLPSSAPLEPETK
jgi:hypothetical protein